MAMMGSAMEGTLGPARRRGNRGRRLDGAEAARQGAAMTPKPSYMALALEEARWAAARGEVPVGCVIVESASGEVMARAANRTEELGDPTAHAEMLALRAAAAKGGAPRLESCDLYVTLEPCPMCAAAISLARVRRLYYGAYDSKMGGVDHGPRIFASSSCHHRPEIYGGIEETACGELMRAFFKERR
jgi:tRNA(Arg) A34 adenosine deaminase TadA